ncbi:hypothetical protein [Lacticaseibacillus jixiensis]|uniref:hypothetical protein n=1 Tax=Lacticaseibacillus jixiensis TaxID=3231926 RepID=UPI0036F1B410
MKLTKRVTLCVTIIIGLVIVAGFLTQNLHATAEQPVGKTVIYNNHGDHTATLTAD